MTLLENISIWSLYAFLILLGITTVVGLIYFKKKKTRQTSSQFNSQRGREERSIQERYIEEPEWFTHEKTNLSESSNPTTPHSPSTPQNEKVNLEQIVLDKIQRGEYDVILKSTDGRRKGAVKFEKIGAYCTVTIMPKRLEKAEPVEEEEEWQESSEKEEKT